MLSFEMFKSNAIAFVLSVILVLLAATASAQTADTAADDAPSAPEQQVEIEQIAPDTAIKQRIESILAATGWYAGLRAAVDEGVVFLDGTTQSDAHRTWARDLAQKTSGVVAVVNRIKVVDAPVWSLAPALSELEQLAENTITILPLLLLALFVLPLAWYSAGLVARLARWLLRERIQSPFLRQVVARAIAFPVFLLGLYIVLQVAGLTQLALSLVGGAGVIGIVIGFAFRDIAENFLSSLILSVRRPFQRGDFIIVAGLSGTVKSMTTRSTLLTSAEGNEIHIPNSTVFKNVIENFTSSPDRRGEFVVGIGYDAGIAEAQGIILAALQEHDAVLRDPEPMVLVDALGAATVNIRTYYWFDGHMISAIKLKSALLRAVKSALTVNGISMPDEAREVIFPEGVRVLQDSPDAPAPQEQQEPVLPRPEPVASAAEGDLLTEEPVDHSAKPEDLESDLLGER
ncbi:MAG: mechanosensitive ion channel family protein [Pseudomonadota bacterium]